MNEITLTPNRRLAATLHKTFVKQQQAQQLICWTTPDILPLTSWLQKCWQQYTLRSSECEPYLLNAAQELFLWEKIIASSRESDQLLQVHETAELVKAANKMLKEWGVAISHPAFQSAEDYAALAKWITEYQRICKQQNWIDAASIVERLHGNISLPKTVHLIGFTELSPQIKNFLQACEKITHQAEPIAVTRRIALEDAEEELLTIARWAKTTHLANKDATIACVIPELEKSRDRVAQIFAEVFAETGAYNISAGKQLTQYPIIDVALQLLGLFKNKVTDVTLSYLLTSPFLGEAEREHSRRGSYDVYIRKENISSTQLEVLLEDSLTKICPALAKRLNEFLTKVKVLPELQNYQQWAVTFNDF